MVPILIFNFSRNWTIQIQFPSPYGRIYTQKKILNKFPPKINKIKTVNQHVIDTFIRWGKKIPDRSCSLVSKKRKRKGKGDNPKVYSFRLEICKHVKVLHDLHLVGALFAGNEDLIACDRITLYSTKFAAFIKSPLDIGRRRRGCTPPPLGGHYLSALSLKILLHSPILEL